MICKFIVHKVYTPAHITLTLLYHTIPPFTNKDITLFQLTGQIRPGMDPRERLETHRPQRLLVHSMDGPDPLCAGHGRWGHTLSLWCSGGSWGLAKTLFKFVVEDETSQLSWDIYIYICIYIYILVYIYIFIILDSVFLQYKWVIIVLFNHFISFSLRGIGHGVDDPPTTPIQVVRDSRGSPGKHPNWDDI